MVKQDGSDRMGTDGLRRLLSQFLRCAYEGVHSEGLSLIQLEEGSAEMSMGTDGLRRLLSQFLRCRGDEGDGGESGQGGFTARA